MSNRKRNEKQHISAKKAVAKKAVCKKAPARFIIEGIRTKNGPLGSMCPRCGRSPRLCSCGS